MNEIGSTSQTEEGLGQYYENMVGNVKKLGDARVVVMGEYHGDKDSSHNISQLLGNLAEREDILFIEGWPKWLRVPRLFARDYHVPKGVRIYGWDDVKENERAIETIHKPQHLSVRFVKNLIKMLSMSPEEQLEFLRQKDLERNVRETQREQVVQKVVITDRNETLLNVIGIGRKRYPNARMFFIAGRNHLNPQLEQGLLFMNVPHALVQAKSSLNSGK